jgi:RAP1 GTPase activating protein 1
LPGGKTGEHSVFAELPSDIPERPYEVMYHVSTLLPHSKKDVQQLERKRHLGNDVVVIVFQAGDTIFDPTCIASEFNRTQLQLRLLSLSLSSSCSVFSFVELT